MVPPIPQMGILSLSEEEEGEGEQWGGEEERGEELLKRRSRVRKEAGIH